MDIFGITTQPKKGQEVMFLFYKMSNNFRGEEIAVQLFEFFIVTVMASLIIRHPPTQENIIIAWWVDHITMLYFLFGPAAKKKHKRHVPIPKTHILIQSTDPFNRKQLQFRTLDRTVSESGYR